MNASCLFVCCRAGPVSGHESAHGAGHAGGGGHVAAATPSTTVVTQLLNRAFTSQFVFPVLGPDMRHPDHYKQAAEIWRNWLPEEAMPTFYRGGCGWASGPSNT